MGGGCGGAQRAEEFPMPEFEPQVAVDAEGLTRVSAQWCRVQYLCAHDRGLVRKQPDGQGINGESQRLGARAQSEPPLS